LFDIIYHNIVIFGLFSIFYIPISLNDLDVNVFPALSVPVISTYINHVPEGRIADADIDKLAVAPTMDITDPEPQARVLSLEFLRTIPVIVCIFLSSVIDQLTVDPPMSGR
jgi:hypothetical protein